MEREYRTAEGTQDAGGRHIEFAPIRLPAGRRIDYNRLRRYGPKGADLQPAMGVAVDFGKPPRGTVEGLGTSW